MTEAWRASGVFIESETSLMREAYELAVLALSLTHRIDDIVKTILADCIIRILRTESMPASDREHITSAVAARGVDQLLMTYNACICAERKTLH